MIRALEQLVPEVMLGLFRRKDPKKNPAGFWKLLAAWYKDDTEENVWFADWEEFYFPGAEFEASPAQAMIEGFPGASFQSARFVRRANFRNAYLPGSSFIAAHFLENADFRGVHTPRLGVSFRNARFGSRADFAGAKFGGYTDFNYATFVGDADFSGMEVRQNMLDFGSATFMAGAEFRGMRVLRGATVFSGASLPPSVRFANVAFGGYTRFEGARMEGACSFGQCVIGEELILGARLSPGATLTLIELGSTPGEPSSSRPTGAPLIRFGAMPLDQVEVRATPPDRFRLKDARAIEKFVMIGPPWPQPKPNRRRTADEDDLEALPSMEEKRSASPEVERIYQGLRKNFEESGDRIGAHGWYFAEMEVGRRYAPRRSLRRVARGIYKATSNYGLSARRPLAWLGVVAVVSFALFVFGGSQFCPTRGPLGPCAGWGASLNVVLLALFLQGPPAGIVFSGVPGQVFWILARVVGAAMLLAVFVAFRNQVAR